MAAAPEDQVAITHLTLPATRCRARQGTPNPHQPDVMLAFHRDPLGTPGPLASVSFLSTARPRAVSC